MSIDHVLSVVPVTDIRGAREWYERLIGRAPDNQPMDTLVEWRLTESGWLQVFNDPDRAGNGLVNFAVTDLDRHLAELSTRGLTPGEVQLANKNVRLSTVIDPDGNRITFIGNFRIEY